MSVIPREESWCYQTLESNWALYLLPAGPGLSDLSSGYHYLLDNAICCGCIYQLDSNHQTLQLVIISD